ncbi:MAG: thioredoxin domain-containing protein [Bdellovibrionales bacterium]
MSRQIVNRQIVKLVMIGFGVFGVAACSPSAQQLKEVMKQHPDILHAAIEADPKGFFDIVQKVQGKAREQSMAGQMEGELKRVMEEIKSPKTVEFDEARAVVGPITAPITIIEWADFNCGHCVHAAETVEKIAVEYKDKVRILFKHLPILAPESKLAAQYMEAISLQDNAKAIEFHKKLFASQGELRSGGEKFLKKLTKEVGADVAKTEKDSKGAIVKKRIDSDVAEAQKYEFNGTPGFMVNGASVHGAYPIEFFKKVIDAILAEKK